MPGPQGVTSLVCVSQRPAGGRDGGADRTRGRRCGHTTAGIQTAGRRPGTRVTASADTRPSRNIALFTWSERRRDPVRFHPSRCIQPSRSSRPDAAAPDPAPVVPASTAPGCRTAPANAFPGIVRTWSRYASATTCRSSAARASTSTVAVDSVQTGQSAWRSASVSTGRPGLVAASSSTYPAINDRLDRQPGRDRAGKRETAKPDRSCASKSGQVRLRLTRATSRLG